LMAFLCSVIVGASRFAHTDWLRSDKALHAMRGIRALTQFATSSPASAKGPSKRSGVLSGVGFCLFSVSRWRGLAWIWVRRSSSAAEGRRVPPRPALVLPLRSQPWRMHGASASTDKNKPMLEAMLRCQLPTSPKLDSSDPTGHAFCAT